MNHGLREGPEKGGTKGPPSKPRPPGAPPSQRPTEGYQPRPDSKSPGPPPQGGSGLSPLPTVLSPRQELMARFIEAHLRAGSEANISFTVQWALDLADAVLKAEQP